MCVTTAVSISMLPRVTPSVLVSQQHNLLLLLLLVELAASVRQISGGLPRWETVLADAMTIIIQCKFRVF